MPAGALSLHSAAVMLMRKALSKLWSDAAAWSDSNPWSE